MTFTTITNSLVLGQLGTGMADLAATDLALGAALEESAAHPELVEGGVSLGEGVTANPFAASDVSPFVRGTTGGSEVDPFV